MNWTQKLKPSLVTMDLNMPRMDGFAATKEIMITAPTPIVVVTGSSQAAEVATAVQALTPARRYSRSRPRRAIRASRKSRQKLVSTVETMAHVKVVRHWRSPARPPAADVALGAEFASTGRPAANGNNRRLYWRTGGVAGAIITLAG